jgi:hypothetical protein
MNGISIPGKEIIKNARSFFTLLVLSSSVFCSRGITQTPVSEPVARLLIKLDSVRKSPSVSRHFAELYFETTVNAVHFFSESGDTIKGLVDRMQLRFADYFFRSAFAFREGLEIPSAWKTYYSDTSAPALRCMLYGINAHINGDIWQAITTEFSPEEIRSLKPHYLAYRKGLLDIYKELYRKALESHNLVGLLHRTSFGMDKLYGKHMLNRWRKRQLRLSELYYINRELFESEHKKLTLKMERLNRLIRKNI